MKRLAWCLVAMVIGCGVARAHDAEHTAVSITFARDGSFVLEVVNDPNWLLLRLESFVAMDPPDLKGPGLPGPVSAGRYIDRDARLRELSSVFIDRIVIFVDGQEVRPVFAEYVPPLLPSPGIPAPLAAYRMRGRLSPDARVLRWYYGMVVDPYPLEINRADGRSLNEWIVAGDAWSRTIDLTGQFVKPTRIETARRYSALGYAQILPRGIAPVLFILGLFMLSISVRPIALQISAFTIASAIGMWLTGYAVVSVSPATIDALVALSVAYVAIENLVTRELLPWRVPLVLLFGGAHGAAFGLAVKELALTRGELPLALVWFTAGLEAGQLTVVALASVLVAAFTVRVRARSRSA